VTRKDHGTLPQEGAKPTWRSPKLEELGNLRDFVQAGNAFGKSLGSGDGNADPGGEKMDVM
jgi:hypothetical protein